MTTERFHYKHDGHEIALPYMKNLKAGMLRKIRKLPLDDQVFTILEQVASEDDLAILDDMDGDELNAFIAAWQEASGVTLGESQASSTS